MPKKFIKSRKDDCTSQVLSEWIPLNVRTFVLGHCFSTSSPGSGGPIALGKQKIMAESKWQRKITLCTGSKIKWRKVSVVSHVPFRISFLVTKYATQKPILKFLLETKLQNIGFSEWCIQIPILAKQHE